MRMIATINLYEDKEEGRDFVQMSSNPCETWEASISSKLWQWIRDHGYRLAIADRRIIDGEDLVDFEDFYREHYGDYPFTYSAAYRSQALTFKLDDNYGIKFIEE